MTVYLDELAKLIQGIPHVPGKRQHTPTIDDAELAKFVDGHIENAAINNC